MDIENHETTGLAQSPAVKLGLSIALATGLYGVSFGALAVAAGLGVWQTVALSLLMFTGGSQFAFIGVIAGGGAGPAAFSAAAAVWGGLSQGPADEGLEPDVDPSDLPPARGTHQ